MIRAGVGQSQKQLTGQAVEEAACQAMARAGISRADLALIFFTAEHAARSHELVSALARSVGTDCIFGSSGAGIVTGARRDRGQHGVAVLVLASDEIIGRPFIFEPLKGNEANLGATFGEFLAKADDKNSLMILLPDSYNGNPQPLLASMEAKRAFTPRLAPAQRKTARRGATYQLCGDKLREQLHRRRLSLRRFPGTHRYYPRMPTDHRADGDYQGRG